MENKLKRMCINKKVKGIQNKIKQDLKYAYNNIREFILVKFHKKPIILDNEQTINRIVNNNYSISRFGDGEFFLMTEEKGFEFQKIDKRLSTRLLEVFNSNEKGLMIGIPKIFEKEDLEFRTESSKKWWSNYLLERRNIWYKYLDFTKVYANTNFTRNYIAVKDKSTCKKYFDDIKKIWEDKDILIVEGRYSRLGIGNDLFDKSKSIKRILAPNENAFNKYEDILNEVKNKNGDRLILIALGPTATILTYDLHKLGYQAIDIGHIDIEYEWFLQGVTEKTKISNKYTFEANGLIKEDDFRNKKYESEIIAIVQ